MASDSPAFHTRSAVFALLDDCESTAATRSTRLCSGFAHERSITQGAALDSVCAEVQADLRDGLHAVVVADYEFGRHLQFGESEKAQPGHAALRFLLFRDCVRLSRDEADAWLASQDNGADEPSAAAVAGIEASVTRDAFDAGIAAIHEALRAGDSYQVNYTYRLTFDIFGTPFALYRRLRKRQPVRYGALIALPDGRAVLSCSPELFVERQADVLRARPMKGTAPRESDPRLLHDDPKNRAENVMIVDLLRNDMSRVAATGSVKVPALFSIEAYASVWQMTSTIEARVRPGVVFADIVRALFPCGSITGAPKYKTMQLIDAIESTPRGLYTGAIGWLDREGDFCLSVAIRTLVVSEGRGEMGVGAGIVLDSIADDEYAECRLKAAFLTGADPGFELFETTYATREDGVRHFERHLARLTQSARYLGFGLDERTLRTRIAEHCESFDEDEDTPYRLRIALSKDGTITLTSAPLAPLPTNEVDVLLAREHGFAPQSSSDMLLRHKTTHRADYDRAWKAAEAQGAFDMIFVNERGEVTEGGRSTIFVEMNGRWCTPPVEAGVLPGVMRAVLLEELSALERTITREELESADALMISNALRGAVKARLVRSDKKA